MNELKQSIESQLLKQGCRSDEWNAGFNAACKFVLGEIERAKSKATEIATRLRDCSKGRQVYRVRDKDTKAYSIEFEIWEQIEAGECWKLCRDLDFHKNDELALVTVKTHQELLMNEAADILETI